MWGGVTEPEIAQGLRVQDTRLWFRCQQFLQQIGHVQISCPLTEINQIQSFALYHHYPSRVIPLLLRAFTTQTIPAEFAEDRVFRRGHRKLDRFSTKQA